MLDEVKNNMIVVRDSHVRLRNKHQRPDSPELNQEMASLPKPKFSFFIVKRVENDNKFLTTKIQCIVFSQR